MLDFNILKNSFGKSLGDPGNGPPADFTGDHTVNILDYIYIPIKVNFAACGAPGT